MKKSICLSLAPALLVSLASATILYVPQNYPTIQLGINAANTYDTVLVAAGMYYEHIDFLGKEIVVKSASGPEATTIDGGTYDGYVVTFSGGENPETLLEGFTITHGYGLNPPGGGILCDTLCGPTIRGNHIISNGGQWNCFGGGISAWAAAPHIEENLLQGNVCVYYGAGIFLSGCYDVIVRHNVISQNLTTSGYGVAVGGGVFSLNSESQIQWNLFVGNQADPDHGYGGAIAVDGSGNCDLRFNTFSENESGIFGLPTGGSLCLGAYQNCTATINFMDNILANSPQGGGFSLFTGAPILRIDFNDVWGNVPFNYYGCSPGPFDLCTDPLFVGGSPFSYELTANSPCVDAGSFMENPDPDGTRADIGVYPYSREGMNVTFQPFVWPINIPASGGWFAGHFFLTNHTSAVANFDFWVDVQLPDSSLFGPVILRQDLTFSPEQQIMRIAVQDVPGGAPAGNYLYRSCTGDYEAGQVFCEMTMPFTKLGSEGSDGSWAIRGDLAEWGNVTEMTAALPAAVRLEASPNPFNPVTILSFDLAVASLVRLEVFDVSGCLVGAHGCAPTPGEGSTPGLQWYPAGTHQITFDGSDLPSGIYFAQLTVQPSGSVTTPTTAVQKLVLLK